ncbi:MAG: hypothetical protein NVSMB45_00470 [Ginsengibacter sp.]
MATNKKAALTAKKSPSKATKPLVTKAAPKKPVAKPAFKKAATSKASKVQPKASAKKVVSQKKAAPAKKAAKPIQKNIPVKKSTTPVKKATPKKMATPVKKTAPAAKAKHAPAKAAVSKPTAKAAPAKAAPVKAALESAKKKVEPIAQKAPDPIAKPLPAAKDIKVAKPKPVVLPKITTTKSRKYEPDFTKSVLDKVVPDQNGPSQRYSDNELNDFKELILRKLEAAKKELGYLQGLITRKDEMGGDDTDNRYMTMEDGSLSMEREQLSQMASRQITFIDHLEKAMMRIENKTYGICRVTGKLIDKARLRAVPHATLSIEAKMGMK